MINLLARAERDLILAADQLSHPARYRAFRVAAATYGTLVTALALEGASAVTIASRSLLHDCEQCGSPAVHAETHFDERRFWCTEHTPWSGHVDHCGAACESLCCETDP